MPNNSVIIGKNIKTYMLNTCVITENAKLRKIKHNKLVTYVCLLSLVVFCALLANSLPEVGSGRTVLRSPPSTVEFLHP
jgi:hypothetical protein